ncbi:MAG: DUF1800 domain-containing protein [Pseudomonadota bacterium]
MLRITLISALTFCASDVIAGPDAMTPEEARHLISRTGFGASPDDIAALTGKSYADGVDIILGTLQTEPVTPMPSWVDMWPYPQEFVWQLGQTKTELFYTNRWLEIEELSAWWMAEMISTPSPLTERLVLFWHDHFATSFEVSENPQWMAAQNRFFRTHAAGNFADLAHGILQDPAMLDYLSNTSNVVDAPNENLGREFLELFTLGENRGYNQDDVRAAARALTGHTVAEYGAPVYDFDPELHDDGQKTLFGQSGLFGAADLADLSLSHPEFGPYVVEKLWREFISDHPDPDEVERLVVLWRANDLELKPLLHGLFMTDAFWDRSNRGRLIKSPVETLVGTVRSLGQPVADARDLVWSASDNGQTLFMPPNVGGWPDGVGWINDASASGRATALTYLLGMDQDYSDTGMSVMGGVAGEVTTASPDDLRIGQTFVTYVEDEGNELGAAIILYDVGFAGQDWRSLTLWLAHDAAEDFVGLYINTADCAPDCLKTVPSEPDDPDWAKFESWDGFLDAHGPIAPTDRAFLRAINQHLPELIRTTADHRVWRPDPDYDEAPPDMSRLLAAGQILARKSDDMLGQADVELVLAFSHPNALGLTGLNVVGDVDDIDAYVAAREEAAGFPAVPPVTYDTARDWLNALPGDALESKRATQALLAVPRQTQGVRHEMVVRDVEALLRTLILSPEYQVN